VRFSVLVRRLGENALRFRLAAKWSQEEVAHRSGLTVRAYASIERGQTTNPSLGSIHALAEALGLEVSDLLAVAPSGQKPPPGLPRGRYAKRGRRP
jgi:transcriptional regulator with XRE-family HTH domain